MLYPCSWTIRSYIAASSSGVRSSRWRFSMIAISSAVSSSISSIRAGIVSSPARPDARQRLEDHPWLLGIRFDVVDLDDTDTDRSRRTVGRQQADDGRGEFGVLA